MPDGLANLRYAVDDVESAVASRHDVVSGSSGRRIVPEEATRNPIELFQPAGA